MSLQVPKKGEYRPWMMYILATAAVALTGGNVYQYTAARSDLRSDQRECEKRMAEERAFFRDRLEKCQEQAFKVERELNDFLKIQLEINREQQRKINNLIR